MIFEKYLNRAPIPEIAAVQPNARDCIFVADTSGFANELVKCGIVSPDSSYYRDLIEGNLSKVAESDAMLEKLEERVPTSRTWTNTADVCGSMPIVPALLAGHPQSMRLRQRRKRPAGPLAIFLETTGSSATQSGADLRGAAMLALARKLGEYRPIELYVCITYGMRDVMNGVLVKIETTPLDLGRAVAMLGTMSSTAGYGVSLTRKIGNDWVGGWSYGSAHLERRWCGEIFKRFLNPSSDVLYVPAAYQTDNWHDAPKWLDSMLEKYGGETIESED